MNIEIQPKYKINDEVWFLAGERILSEEISQITADVHILETNEVFVYSFKYRISSELLYDGYLEEKLFDTKEKLINSLMGE